MLKSIGLSCILLGIFNWGMGQDFRGYDLVEAYPEVLVNPYSRPFSPDSVITAFPKDVIHPHLFESLSISERDSIRRIVISRMKKDTLNLTESLYAFKPYFDRLKFEDPHFRPLIPWFITKNNRANSDKIPILPWDIININDTIIIDHSYDEKFHKGDRILEINNTPVEEFIKYTYTNRYSPFIVYQAYYHYAYSPGYTVKTQRQNQILNIHTGGITYDHYLKNKISENQKKIWADYKTGYFSIPAFRYNKSIIKDLYSFIKRLKKIGYPNLIIDIRKNGGGSGSDFDELMSLFVNKDTVVYLKNVRLRVSPNTIKDYDFLTEDRMGQLINLPERYFVKSFPLNKEKYQNMNIYVLISEDTGSQAATFANILQYNGSAKLAGVPLLHNALKYGEITHLPWSSNPYATVSISTIELDEYTRNPDGQVYPDIEIPFVALEYMKGGDPVLEKLLEHIREYTVK